jgi:hypothetical protein
MRLQALDTVGLMETVYDGVRLANEDAWAEGSQFEETVEGVAIPRLSVTVPEASDLIVG